MRLVSIFNPLRGCNSNLAQYSKTPALHHSAWPDSRTRTTTRTRTKRVVRVYSVRSGESSAFRNLQTMV